MSGYLQFSFYYLEVISILFSNGVNQWQPKQDPSLILSRLIILLKVCFNTLQLPTFSCVESATNQILLICNSKICLFILYIRSSVAGIKLRRYCMVLWSRDGILDCCCSNFALYFGCYCSVFEVTYSCSLLSQTVTMFRISWSCLKI